MPAGAPQRPSAACQPTPGPCIAIFYPSLPRARLSSIKSHAPACASAGGPVPAYCAPEVATPGLPGADMVPGLALFLQASARIDALGEVAAPDGPAARVRAHRLSGRRLR